MEIDVKAVPYMPPWEPELSGAGDLAKDLGIIREAKLPKVLTDFRRAAAEIAQDPMLTDLGREAKLRELGTSTLGELPFFADRVAWTQEVIDKLDAELREAVMPAASDPAAAVRSWEIRDWLRGLDESDRLGVIRGALDENEAETLQAVLDAPKAMNIVRSPQILAAIEEAVMSKADPAKVRKRDQYRRAAAIVKESLDLARADIVKRAGLTESFAERVRAVS